MYELSRNPRYGHLEHLPADGGLLDQPTKTMEALSICIRAYQQTLEKEIKKSLK